MVIAGDGDEFPAFFDADLFEDIDTRYGGLPGQIIPKTGDSIADSMGFKLLKLKGMTDKLAFYRLNYSRKFLTSILR